MVTLLINDLLHVRSDFVSSFVRIPVFGVAVVLRFLAARFLSFCVFICINY